MRRWAGLERRRMGGFVPESGSIDPATLVWELLLDSRNITGLADGAPVTIWPDSSGKGRDALPVPGLNPIYRQSSSPKGLPMVDFGAVTASQMFGSLPAGGLGSSAGFSFYAYYILDSIPKVDGFSSQIVFSDGISGGFRMFGSQFVGAGDSRPAFTTDAGAIQGSGQPGTGPQIMAAICPPPAGSGVAAVTVNGHAIGSGVWTANPQTTYLVSGNGVQNVYLRGRLALAGIAKRNDSPATEAGLLSYLQGAFG